MPAAATVDGETVAVSVIRRVWVADTLAVAFGEVTAPPPAPVPVAVATLPMLPLSTSAWVVVYEAVQVTVAPGASEAAPFGQVGPTRLAWRGRCRHRVGHRDAGHGDVAAVADREGVADDRRPAR